jgi:hypothetical protein
MPKKKKKENNAKEDDMVSPRGKIEKYVNFRGTAAAPIM